MSDERRRLELSNPSKFLTAEERAARAEILITLLIICNAICLIIMIIGTIPIVLIAAEYSGWDCFWIVFIGALIDVGLGFLLAYVMGKKVQKYCEVNL